MSYKEIEGDLLELFDRDEFEVIGHGCNCRNIMGAGIAKQIKERYPDVFYADRHWYMDYGVSRLGNGLFVPIQPAKGISNLYTQVEPGPNADIDALKLAIRKMGVFLNPVNKKFPIRIGLPQIGCGIGGLKWKDVKPIIQEELKDFDVTVVIYNKNK